MAVCCLFTFRVYQQLLNLMCHSMKDFLEYDSLVMSHRTNSFYISIFIYQQKKRSRSWRAGCHNGCTCYDSGVVRYWIVCWIGWHFVITLFQIWDKNDVIVIYNDVIIIFASSIKSDPWFSFSFYCYLHWMESPAYYPIKSSKKDFWLTIQ